MTRALTFQTPKKIDFFSIPRAAYSSEDQRVLSGIVSILLMHSHGGEMNESAHFSSSNLSFLSLSFFFFWHFDAMEPEHTTMKITCNITVSAKE